MEKIRIRDFGGITHLEIPINKINIFIGRQASGKSVTAKLIYYFKNIFREVFEGVQDDKSRNEIHNILLNKFDEIFPKDSRSSKSFEIEYFYNQESIIIYSTDKGKLKVEFSKRLQTLLSQGRRLITNDKSKFTPEDQFETYRISHSVRQKYFSILTNELGKEAYFFPLFIPAGRSFFANLQSSIFSFLSKTKSIDPLLVEFGSFYENIKAINWNMRRLNNSKFDKETRNLAQGITNEILGGGYLREKNEDFLIHDDKRKINVAYASSGQQETLPLLLILNALLQVKFSGDGASVFIEEPEAHLFPNAQKRIVELLGVVFNDPTNDVQLFITTHSPYILTAFNNLIQAGLISQDSNNAEAKTKLYSIINKKQILYPGHLNAYVMRDKTAVSIIDNDTGLVHSLYLDSVSEEIAIQFDELLELL